ncbi:MAG: hypothetical protein M9894_39070 [Planctomycetes bacterium]|nr:hypothetical protein [Planctomycetota bacterium]
MTAPTLTALDGAGRPLEVRALAEVRRGDDRFVLGAPVAAPALVVLYRAPAGGGPLAPVTDPAEQRAVADHLLGQALLPGAPITLEGPDGALTLHRLLTVEVEGVTYDILARGPGDARALVFERRGEDLSLVEDPAVVRAVQARAAATVSAFVGGAPAAEAEAPPTLEEGRALLAELERLMDEVPPAHHPGPEYQALARAARELRAGLERLERERGEAPG